MVAGLSGGKMSSSIEGIWKFQLFSKRPPNSQIDSKIDLLDPPEAVSKKIRKSEAFPRVVENNGVIAMVEFVLLPAAALTGKKEFRVERRDNEPLIYTDIQKLKDDYTEDIVCLYFISPLKLTNSYLRQLTPQLLKPAVAEALTRLMEPIHKGYTDSPEWQEITLKAYPPPVVVKKPKKVKDRGSRFPGAKKENDIPERPKEKDVPESPTA